MLSLFRSNQIAFNLLLIVYVFVLRGSALFVSYAPERWEGQGMLSDWVYSWAGVDNTLTVIIAMVLVFIQALLVNVIVAKFRMATSVSLFPGVFYILLVSMIPEFLALSPVLMANTFFILALWELFETYRKHDVAGHIVNIGFWLGVASLFYFSEIFFLILALIGLNVLRVFRIKEVIMLIFGFLVPFIVAMVYHFWYDSLGFFWQQYVFDRLAFLDIQISGGLANYIKAGIFVCFGLIAFFSLTGYYSKKGIQAQKNITVLFWSLAVTLITILFQTDVQYYHFLMFMVPLGIFLAFNFYSLSPRIAEALHLVLFAGILIWQFHPLWLK